ncbi:PilW family protein [Congregibacter sp.]|uniref:PilW family protein n=1 Tax=Congregibacter sp. TaxID=2744308 RepID=UPI003F6D28E5
MTLTFTFGGQRGYGLIELMVAIALGALLMLAVTEVATRNSSTRNELERTAAQIENGVYSVRAIEGEISNAGFWGETGAQFADPSAAPPVLVGTAADPADAIDELVEGMGYPVQGGSAPTGSDLTLVTGVVVKAGTDYLVVRRASSCAQGDAGCDVADGSDIHMQVNACLPVLPGEPATGDIQMSATIADLDYFAIDCGDATPAVLAPIYRYLSRVFYIDVDDNLMVAQLEGTGANAYANPQQLVDGVEFMQLEYGLDNVAGDGQVDEYRDPVGVEWADVVSVRLSVVVRSPTSTPGFTDDRTYTVGGVTYPVPPDFADHKRQVFARTVPIRNISERRQP